MNQQPALSWIWITCTLCASLVACGDDTSADAGAQPDASVASSSCDNSLDCVDESGGRTICSGKGQCVECVFPADCGESASCKVNVCVPFVTCKNSLDCETTEVCDSISSRCVECVVDADCGGDEDQVCADNNCQTGCRSDNACTPSGMLCDQTAGHCVECVVASDCPDGQLCEAGRCGLDPCDPVDCSDLEPACGPQSDGCGGILDCGACESTTIPNCFDDEQNGDETDTDCGGSSCDACPNGMACSTGSDCTSDLCDALTCKALAPSGECGAGSEEIGRFAEWCGKVNLHTNASGDWETDPDCTSGCGMPPLTYCRKFYPTTESTQSAPVVGTKPFENAACANVYPYIGETEILCCASI